MTITHTAFARPLLAGDPMDPESTSLGFSLSTSDRRVGGNVSEYRNLGAVSDSYRNSDTIETSNIGIRYKLSKSSHIGIGFTDGEETHRRITESFISDLGDDGDENTTMTLTLAPHTSSYEEVMIGGGPNLVAASASAITTRSARSPTAPAARISRQPA